MPRRRRARSSPRGRKRTRKAVSETIESSKPSNDVSIGEDDGASSSKLPKVRKTGARSTTSSGPATLRSTSKKLLSTPESGITKKVSPKSTAKFSITKPVKSEISQQGEDAANVGRGKRNKVILDGVVKQEEKEVCQLSPAKKADTSSICGNFIKEEVIDFGVEAVCVELDPTDQESIAATSVPCEEFNPSFISQVQQCFNTILPQDWFCKATDDGFNIMLLSRCKEKAIQRRIFFSFQGDVEVSVHRKALPSPDVKRLLGDLPPPLSLSPETFDLYVSQGMKIVERLWYLEICSGVDQIEYTYLWAQEKTGVVDTNPYGEIRYSSTLRSVNCKLLIDSNRWRCGECVILTTLLRKKDDLKNSGCKKLYTTNLCEDNTYVDHREKEQGTSKPAVPVNSLTKDVECKTNWNVVVTKDKKPDVSITEGLIAPESCRPKNDSVPASYVNVNLNSSGISLPKDMGIPKPALVITEMLPRMTPMNPVLISKKIKSLIEKDGIAVDDELSRDLTDIIKDLKLSPVQRQFVQEQTELANLKKSFGMRWHPSLIRFALFKKSASSENFPATGMIILPSGRSLFNFSQVLFRMREFQKANINDMLKRVYLASLRPHQCYHALLLDEINVSNNLAFQKSNGELIGFVKLSDVKTEMEKLEDFINQDKPLLSKPIACKILMFMIKGVSNGVKEVMALYASDNMSKEIVYNMTWDLIGTLEQNGIKVVAVVSNGFSRTKEFICMHSPVTKLESGLVFDTINSKAEGRLLYFLLDASYLLKAIRDSFEESGSGGSSQRVLTKNYQTIVWKTIVKLYLARKWLCPKLNVKNVFLNEYSRKKLSYATEVMSSAVARDLASRYWAKTSETVTFILKVNDLFNCFHGTMIDDANPDDKLSIPYTNQDDVRFSKMLEFIDYLNNWKKEIHAMPDLSEEEKYNMFLSDEVSNEIEMSVRAFIDVLKFLLKEGTELINPDVFCLDPIGEYLKAGWFGFRHSGNPVSQLFTKEIRLEIQKV